MLPQLRSGLVSTLPMYWPRLEKRSLNAKVDLPFDGYYAPVPFGLSQMPLGVEPTIFKQTTTIEKRIVRYSKIVIFQSFLLRFRRGFRRFIRLKLFYNLVLSSRKELHCRFFLAEELPTSYLVVIFMWNCDGNRQWTSSDCRLAVCRSWISSFSSLVGGSKQE